MGLLEAALSRAAQRGPDGWGLWVDGLRAAGPGRCPPGAAAGARGGRLALGHARLATMLDTGGSEHAQPIVYGRTIVTHNGSVWNYEALRSVLRLSTGNDSEALAAVVDRAAGSLTAAIAAALRSVDMGEHYAFAIARAGELVLGARAQALYCYRDAAGGLYWSSGQVTRDWAPVDGLVRGS